MARVFLSHAWADRDLALTVKRALEQHGHDIFIDVDVLQYGTEWGATMMSALLNADGVIALLTDTSLRSQFVIAETGAALANRRKDPNKFLIPLLLHHLPLPDLVRHLMIAKIDPSDGAQFSATIEKIADAIDNHAVRARAAESIPRLFVSHRHENEDIARALVECMEARFEIKPADIRCTSVHPYRLRVGADAATKLKEEVVRAEAVLGLIGPNTNESTYVMFELGAAWSNDVFTCPLLIKGATAAHLPDPLHGRHPIDLRNERDAYQLLEDLGTGTTLKRRSENGTDGRVRERIAALVRAASQA